MQISMPLVTYGTYTPAWAETVESNLAHLQAMRVHAPKVIATYTARGFPDHDVYKVTLDKFEDFYYVLGTLNGIEFIQYGVFVERIATIGLAIKTVSQTSVWRNSEYKLLPGLATWMFFKVLLPINGNIMSDKHQSLDGERFWLLRLKEAFAKRLSIDIAVMHKKHVTQLIPVSSMLEITQCYSVKPDMSGEQYRILITRKLL